MAVARRAFKKGTAIVGVSAVGIAYYQRRRPDHGDYRSSWSEGLSTRLYRTFALPSVLLLDPETAHSWSLQLGRIWQAVRLLGEPSWTGATPLDWLLRPVPSASSPSGPNLRQDLFGGRLSFESPLGIAAGFDKNALLVPLYRVGALAGLGFSEVGSVSALPAQGNEKPRCFRLPSDEAVINRIGLANEGSAAVAERLKSYSELSSRSSTSVPVGVNIAKTHSPEILGQAAIDDFIVSYRALAPLADFVVLNVSCPNTAEGKTFEDPSSLGELLHAVSVERQSSASSPPVLVKLSPPIDASSPAGTEQLRTLVDTAKASGIVDGFVVSNTAGDREVKLSADSRQAVVAIGRGGLSGRPLCNRSTATIRKVYELSGGSMPIIGVGGVDSAESAYAKIRAGASLVEVYTAIVYKGPGVFYDIHTGLRRLLERDGFTSISEAVGADFRS